MKMAKGGLGLALAAGFTFHLVALQPAPAQALPEQGNFYSLQQTNTPPLPFNSFPQKPHYALGDDNYLYDDRDVDYAGLQAEAELLSALESELGLSSMLMSSSLASPLAYANPVYLTNLSAVLNTDLLITASFDIRGGTNFVPYDILTTPNIAAPVAEWDWLGIGYTSHRYTFEHQPFEQAHYLLAKPSKTLVVGLGADEVGQCDVPFGLEDATMLAGGGGHTLALRSNGTVLAWGFNNYGQGAVPTDLAGVTMIAAGLYHNVALLTNGNVTAWGLNFPLLGWTMTNVPPDLTNVTVIASQMLHSLALTSNGTVVAWGYNPAGETNVPESLSNVVAIAAGDHHCLAAKADGTVVAWVLNTDGQCAVPVDLSNVVDVAAGIHHSLALRSDGTVVAWGRNASGETNVPAGLSNTVAIAACGDSINGSGYSVALKKRQHPGCVG